VDFKISVCASSSTARLFEFSHSNKFLDQPEEPLPLLVLVGFGRELFGKARWVIHQRSEQHSPARRQRPTSPPEMQGRRVPVPNDFSRADSLLIASSGNATSISFFFIRVRRKREDAAQTRAT